MNDNSIVSSLDSLLAELLEVKIVGLLDLAETIMILSENFDKIADLKPVYFNIENPRGESRTVYDFQALTADSHKIYRAVFPKQ